MKALVTTLLLALLLSGCSWFRGTGETSEPSAPVPSPSSIKSEIKLKTLWSIDVGSEGPETIYRLRPAVGPKYVYVADYAGVVRAVDKSTGRTVWSTDVKNPVSAGPGLGKGIVTVGTRTGEVIALNAATGRILWYSGATSEVLAVPAVADGIVVARAADGRVFGLDASNGHRIWISEYAVPSLTLRGTSDPVVAGDSVYVGLASGKVAALRLKDGKEEWEATVAVPKGRSDLERMVDVDADPVVRGGGVFAVSYQGRLVAIGQSSGRVVWTRDVSAYTGLAVDRSNVYVTDADNQVWAFDAYRGASVWRQNKLAGLHLSGPVVDGDYVVVGDNQGYLDWLSIRDGSLAGRLYVADGAIAQPPVLSGGILYVLTQSGTLSALKVGAASK